MSNGEFDNTLSHWFFCAVCEHIVAFAVGQGDLTYLT